MNEENTKKLLDRFNFFQPTMHNSKTPLSTSGFEVEDGWFDLIWKLCEDLDEMRKHLIIIPEDPFQVLQVKEKFGGLRFYINGCSNDMFQRILKAEHDSFEICETCGAPGKLRNQDGWCTTLCDDCFNEDEEWRRWSRFENCGDCHACHDPNEETIQAIQEAREGKNMSSEPLEPIEKLLEDYDKRNP
jgi:hypothetical protein